MSATARLEHVNVTVSNANAAAASLCKIFDWTIRWSGPSIHAGHSVHVGGKDNYLALYTPQSLSKNRLNNYTQVNGLNHIGIVVDDLDAAERKVVDAGYEPKSHYDYEPGRRFYFDDDHGIEFEVISYAPKRDSFWRHFMKMLGAMSANAALMK